MQENQQHISVDVFVGVGVGVDKGHLQAVAVDRTGKRLYNKALPNDETRLRALITELKTHGQLLFVVDQPATAVMQRMDEQQSLHSGLALFFDDPFDNVSNR